MLLLIKAQQRHADLLPARLGSAEQTRRALRLAGCGRDHACRSQALGNAGPRCKTCSQLQAPLNERPGAIELSFASCDFRQAIELGRSGELEAGLFKTGKRGFVVATRLDQVALGVRQGAKVSEADVHLLSQTEPPVQPQRFGNRSAGLRKLSLSERGQADVYQRL